MNLYAAKKDDFWYKVEPKEKKERTTKEPQYQFDSLENNAKTQSYGLAPLWGLGPMLSFGGGLMIDEPYLEDEHNRPGVLNVDLTFKDRAWHRLRLGGTFTFYSQFLTFLSWDYTPSRKAQRNFYSLGVGLVISPEDEFRNFLSIKNYLLAPGIGREFLLRGRRGVRIEAKALIGTQGSGLLASVSFLWGL